MIICIIFTVLQLLGLAPQSQSHDMSSLQSKAQASEMNQLHRSHKLQKMMGSSERQFTKEKPIEDLHKEHMTMLKNTLKDSEFITAFQLKISDPKSLLHKKVSPLVPHIFHEALSKKIYHAHFFALTYNRETKSYHYLHFGFTGKRPRRGG